MIVFRTARLGNKGVQEVQSHPFFKNDTWDFNNIRECVPPIPCELSGDDDTRNFDDVENETPNEDFPTPKAFAGNHLPFVGFTYSKDYQLLSGDPNSNRPPPALPGRVCVLLDTIFNKNKYFKHKKVSKLILKNAFYFFYFFGGFLGVIGAYSGKKCKDISFVFCWKFFQPFAFVYVVYKYLCVCLYFL